MIFQLINISHVLIVCIYIVNVYQVNIERGLKNVTNSKIHSLGGFGSKSHLGQLDLDMKLGANIEIW
jgi:hypothetical protein